MSVDLSQLAVRRQSPGDSPPTRRRSLWSRYVLPVGILASFAALILWAARDSLLPAREVTVVPVHVTRDTSQPANTPMFIAAGWVEPAPFPISVTALAEGVVEKMLVVEGQQVEKGKPIAHLIRKDAEIGVAHAAAEREMRAAELDSSRAQLEAAETSLAQPVHLDAQVADAEAMLVKMTTEEANLPLQIQAAKARVAIAEQDLKGKKEAGDSIPARALQRARSEVDSAAAALAELEQRKPRLQNEVKALTAKRDAMRTQRELKIEEKRKVAEAKAGVASSSGKLHQAEALEEAAQLRLDRMTIKSPMTGRVLARVAREGTRLMGQKGEADQDSSTVATLYDPAKLQVRADVRLEDVPRVTLHQQVRIETAAVPDGLTGEVTSITSVADIQKNTLAVKILILDPPPQIKPEMLAKVTFLSAAEPGDKTAALVEKILVPKGLVHTEGDVRYVWLADQAAGVARKRTVTGGTVMKGELCEVGGLNAADKLISGDGAGLSDGMRIRVTGEANASR